MKNSIVEKLTWRIKRRYRDLECTLIPVTQFIIITSGRTGSSFLTSLLQANPAVTSCGEYFTDNRLKEENLAGRDLLAEFTEAMKREQHEKARGVKFLYYQLEPS